jgi:hypothetical protein
MNRSLALATTTVVIALVPTSAEAVVIANWRMDEPADARVMVDSASAGGANNGSIVNVTTGVAGLVSGSAYLFGGPNSFVEVPDNDRLDPGTAGITLLATVQIKDGPMSDDSYDVVRKGFVTTRGGYWKMEIIRASNSAVGRLHCLFRGILPNGEASLVSSRVTTDVVDGKTHRLQCVRTASGVRAVVDGAGSSTSGRTGNIANAAPVTVGAKSATDDVLQGTLDEVRVNIG